MQFTLKEYLLIVPSVAALVPLLFFLLNIWRIGGYIEDVTPNLRKLRRSTYSEKHLAEVDLANFKLMRRIASVAVFTVLGLILCILSYAILVHEKV